MTENLGIVGIDTAMILAAGRGARLRPLTDRLPKPLVHLAGYTLIEHHLRRLTAIGMRRVVINLHHLGGQIRSHIEALDLGSLEIRWSEETHLLETAGGIEAALPLLGDAPFMVVNGDVFSDFDLARLRSGTDGALAHLVMVPSPAWASHGDFDLTPNAAGGAARAPLRIGSDQRLTYAGIGLFTPALFATATPGVMPLRPLLDSAIAAGRISGEVHAGIWEDIGTLQRLEAARLRFGP